MVIHAYLMLLVQGFYSLAGCSALLRNNHIKEEKTTKTNYQYEECTVMNVGINIYFYYTISKE